MMDFQFGWLLNLIVYLPLAGALLMMAGGFLAASDKRYRRKRAEAEEKTKTGAPLAEAPA